VTSRDPKKNLLTRLWGRVRKGEKLGVGKKRGGMCHLSKKLGVGKGKGDTIKEGSDRGNKVGLAKKGAGGVVSREGAVNEIVKKK